MAQGDGDSEALGSAGAAGAVSTVTYEQLADLETDFDDVDLQLRELHKSLKTIILC